MPRRSSFPASSGAPFSRRSFLQWSAAASALATTSIVTEPMLAWADVHPVPKDAVFINANENPLGPCAAAREAAAAILPKGGRYQLELTEELTETVARMEGLKPEYVAIYAGSSEPLHLAVLAYTSSTRSYVTADPGYEAGMRAAQFSGARIVKAPLTTSHAHDVKAMLAAGSDGGLFYVCNPNNPTGTITSHADIEFLVQSQPKGSIVMVDEAYIHFSDADSVIDLVKAGKDLIVLRTFSKIFGMAGLRCGALIGRPELIAKINGMAGWNAQPVTAVAAALASLHDSSVVPERKRINAETRQKTFDWLDHNGFSYMPSQTNCFMLDTGRSAKTVIDAMAQQSVIIGRAWPVMPTWVRITVGTRPEMEQFQTAFQKVMSGAVVGSLLSPRRSARNHLDGVRVSG